MADDPLDSLTHQELADLAREFFLAGQMIDRAGMPHLIAAFGRDEMEAIAIAEWMGASPIYSRRMQQTLGFAGDDIDTMFKGMQLDIGAPPEFMDFRYVVHDSRHGEFRLDHCGALMDVEPMGEDYVTTMCHHIEDPTFDATACASNPHARMSPVHRPPRSPAERHPHCHWNVIIDETVPALDTPARCSLIGSTHAAHQPVSTPTTDPGPLAVPGGEPTGRWHDYSHPLDADMRMEDFSVAALRAIIREAALQAHLLVASFTSSIAERHDAATALDVAERQFAGVAGLTAGRLVRARHGSGDLDTLDALADIFGLHPAFHPQPYVGWAVERHADHVELCLADCDASRESVAPMWINLLAERRDRALTTIARAVDPAAMVHPVAGDGEGNGDDRWRWRVTIGRDAHSEDPDVALTKFSSGATFEFRRVGVRDISADLGPNVPASTRVAVRPSRRGSNMTSTTANPSSPTATTTSRASNTSNTNDTINTNEAT